MEVLVADAVINDNSGDQEETLHQDCMWETTDNYWGHTEVFNCDFGPRNDAENISDIIECFDLFFDKEIVQEIIWETKRHKEQYKNTWGNLFPFHSFVRLWTPVTENKIYTVLRCFYRCTLQKPTASNT
jgi:hypothetical protein